MSAISFAVIIVVPISIIIHSSFLDFSIVYNEKPISVQCYFSTLFIVL